MNMDRIEYNLIQGLGIGLWKYRAEGNSNIVIALQTGQVLRLPKVKAGTEESHKIDWSGERKKLEREVSFAKNIFSRLIGSQFIGTIEIVMLTQAQIAELNFNLKTLRPANRQHKALGVPFGTCRTDFTRILSRGTHRTNYSVEIKPKKGWYLNEHLEGSPSPSLCTFCLNQFLKLKIGKISRRSSYCPLDLFSGDPVRVIGALVALTEHPQNNFRIFRDGDMVYGDHLSEAESLASILAEWFSNPCRDNPSSATLDRRNLKELLYLLSAALLKPVSDTQLLDSCRGSIKGYSDFILELENILGTDSGPILPKGQSTGGCNAERLALPAGCILSRILRAQMLGINRGSESIYDVYHKFCPLHFSVPEKDLPKCPNRACWVNEVWLDEVDVICSERAWVEEYLVGATAMDCSLMLTFCKLEADGTACEEPGQVLQDLHGRRHEFKIGVTDLDPKPLTTIVKHRLAEIDMLQAYHSCYQNQFNALRSTNVNTVP